MTASEMLLQSNTGTSEEWITFTEVEKLMTEFAKYHTVQTIKKLSKTEREYQYNIQYEYPLKNIK